MSFQEIKTFEERKNALYYIVKFLVYTISKDEALSYGLNLTEEEKESEYINVYHKRDLEQDKIAFELVGAKGDYLSKLDIYEIYNQIIEFTIDNKEEIKKYAPTKNRF